ncbi:MAG: hypothetical protein EOM87_08880, partial [Clostridia bacterium]|nr:hypothetical protein [Clostridia bacterium]
VWYCCSIDVFFRISKMFHIDYGLINILTYISGFLMYLPFLYVLYKHDIIGKLNSKRAGIFIGANILAMILYFITYGYNYMYVFFIIPALTMLYYICKICISIAKRQKYSIQYLVIAIFLYMIYVLQLSDNTGLALVGASGAYSIALIVIMLMITTIYIIQVKDKINNSRNAEMLEKEISEVKNRALKAQIKPHFMFNVLTSVQDIYHNNLEEGDNALAKFCKHLRLNVDSEYKDMVSFTEELNNIQNYFDLENIRKDGKLTLLYDIDYENFELPILSLQPLIENAVKYAKTEEKEDGYIQIRSYEEGDNIIIEVNDNGIGFAESDLKTNSTGLNNISERLKYSLNADVNFNSVIGAGTTIKIIIPKKGDLSNESNSN